MDKEQQPDISEIFKSLSENGQKLLISMCHPNDMGVELDTISVTSDLKGIELQEAMEELTQGVEASVKKDILHL